MAILRRHLLDKIPVSDLCEELGLQPTVFDRWQKEFFENGAAAFHCGDATMLRDNLAGLIEPMRAARELTLSRCSQNRKSHRTIDPHASKISAPKGQNLH